MGSIVQPVERSYLDTLADRCSGWYLGLPSERCSYATQSVRIPMEDGIHLTGDLFLPLDHSPSTPQTSRPLILVQSCYGRSKAMAIFNAHVYAARSYPVLFVSSRGTFGSEGTFAPGKNEASDGQDIVAWMRTQVWYPGKFVTAGASYLGYASWALLRDPPGHCVGAIIPAAFHDMARQSWGTGALLMQRIEWSEMIVHQEDEFPGLVGLLGARLSGMKGPGFRKALEGVPLMDSVLEHFHGSAPWLKEWLTRPKLEDPYWEDARHGLALERVNVPILLVMGWYDLFSRRGQTIDGYQRLRERGCRVSLTIGPWGHVDASGLKSTPDILEFLDGHVATEIAPAVEGVKVYVTGRQEWRRMHSWPPTTTCRMFYLQEDDSLGPDPPATDALERCFTYNPADPTPTVDAGNEVPDHFRNRPDILTYTSSLLDADLEVFGPPLIQLDHSSDIPFVDLCVRLIEVDPTTGLSQPIAETYQALEPNRDTTPVQLRLSECAHVFQKGTCIQVMVAGGSFPMFARNLGIEGNRTTGSKMRPAKHTVSVAGGLSRLMLPVAA